MKKLTKWLAAALAVLMLAATLTACGMSADNSALYEKEHLEIFNLCFKSVGLEEKKNTLREDAAFYLDRALQAADQQTGEVDASLVEFSTLNSDQTTRTNVSMMNKKSETNGKRILLGLSDKEMKNEIDIFRSEASSITEGVKTMMSKMQEIGIAVKKQGGVYYIAIAYTEVNTPEVDVTPV